MLGRVLNDRQFTNVCAGPLICPSFFLLSRETVTVGKEYEDTKVSLPRYIREFLVRVGQRNRKR